MHKLFSVPAPGALMSHLCCLLIPEMAVYFRVEALKLLSGHIYEFLSAISTNINSLLRNLICINYDAEKTSTAVNPFNASCSRLLLFKVFSAILV